MDITNTFVRKITKSKIVYSFIFLLSINFIFHFLPFERDSLSPDGYVFSYKSLNLSYFDILSRNIFKKPDRPLGYLILLFLGKFYGLNPKLGLFVMFLSSSFLVMLIYLLFYAIIKDEKLTVFLTILFVVLPNILECYGYPFITYIHLSTIVYILSYLLFIKYIHTRRSYYIAFSIVFFTIGILSYEVGFFLPFLLLIHILIFNFERRFIFKVGLYFIPMLLYVVIRITSGFGYLTRAQYHSINLRTLPINFFDLFHHYFGRYMIRTFAYGIYKFFTIEIKWLIPIFLINMIFLNCMYRWINKLQFTKLNKRFLYLGISMFILFLIPPILNGSGGIGQRHLLLPSLGFVIILGYLLGKSTFNWKQGYKLIFILLLIISQGTTWTYVIASRVTGSLFEHLKKRKQELKSAKNIIIDTKSFAENIPYAWVNKKFNVFNTYYGAQAFEDWGLKTLIKIIVGREKKNVYIAVSKPVIKENNYIEFNVFNYKGYRHKESIKKWVFINNSIIIDYFDVYQKGFHNGLV